MDYYCFTFQPAPEEIFADVLIATLGEIGFDSFEQEDVLKAYIPVCEFNEESFENCMNTWAFGKLDYSREFIPEQNWNAVWESQYVGVCFDDFCYVHAPFHENKEGVKHNILIEPKMSFGTAHHQTTALMIEFIRQTPFVGKSVLDMGCGTGVLAILAKKEGASYLEAIDNDTWAYENSLENVQRNGCSDIRVLLGDASALENKKFDILIANINRNILIRDMQIYAACLESGGILFLSGFYEEDIPKLELVCNENSLFYQEHKVKNRWAALKFIKK